MRRTFKTDRLAGGLGWTAGLALFLSLLALFLARGGPIRPGQAAGGVSLAVDAVTDGNTASELGATDTCRRVEVGSTFDIDLVVRNVNGLRAFELYFGFDGSKLEVVNNDVHLFLGAPAHDLSNSLPDTSGHYYAGAFTLGTTTSGSGVLARLTLMALAPGFSTADIAAYPAPPALNPGSNIPIDGGIANAQIAIAADCADAPAPGPTASSVPTPSPEPATPTPSPTPTPSATPTQTPSGSSTATPAPTPSQTPLCDSSSGGCVPVLHWGDTDCDQNMSIGDAQKLARHLIDLPINQAPDCPRVGAPVADGQGFVMWGDVDCSEAVSVGDAQKVARNLVGLTVTLAANCPAFGSVLGGP